MGFLNKLFGRRQNDREIVPKFEASPSEPEPAPEPIRITEISPQALHGQLQQGNNLVVVDMRSQGEYQAGHIPGAIHMFIQEIPARFTELPRDTNIVFQCWHGNTSLDASGFLIQNGWPASNVASLNGGMAGWVQTYGQESLAEE